MTYCLFQRGFLSDVSFKYGNDGRLAVFPLGILSAVAQIFYFIFAAVIRIYQQWATAAKMNIGETLASL